MKKQEKNCNCKLKIIFNSKRRGRTKGIIDAAKMIEGDYVIVCSPSNHSENNMVENILKISQKRNVDILEFNCNIKSPIKLKGTIREKHIQPINIKDNPSIFAYTYPIFFNKIIKSEIFKKAVVSNHTPTLNSRFSIEFLYECFMLSETYSTYSKDIITLTVIENNTDALNPLAAIRQWKKIIEFFQTNHNEIDEAPLIYAFYFYLVVFLVPLVREQKNKTLSNKFKVEFQKLSKGVFKNFFIMNPFIIKSDEEAQALLKNKEWNKLHKIHRSLS